MPEGTVRRPSDSYAPASRCTRRAARTAEIGKLDDLLRMYVQRRHWLDYDPIAFTVLVLGIGMVELLALII